MYAIIETGGKQYRVTPGDVVALEKLEGSVGQTITFDKVLLVGGKTDSKVLVGTPYVTKAALQAEIVEQGKGEKLLTIKYKRRKGYRRMIGHRQDLTRVLITKIEDGQGQSLAFEAAKRPDVLRKASVAFSERKAKRAAEHGTKAPKKTAASAKAEGAASKKTAGASKAKKTTTTKKAD
jgi:large subunit ribosomal protein L21